jgi:hypothetical protein
MKIVTFGGGTGCYDFYKLKDLIFKISKDCGIILLWQ